VNTHDRRVTLVKCHLRHVIPQVLGIGVLATSSVNAAQQELRAGDSGNKNIETVTVTATKREERIEDVPISISVLGGEDLDRSSVQGVTEALRSVPGVGINVAHQGGGTQVVIRGVTAGGTIANGSSPVSYYLDSVPFGLVRQAVAPDANVFDLERVEVLRGPQGTLYGASAQNGVVRILTRDADTDEFEIKGRTSGSSTQNGGESYRGDLAVNVPVIEGKLGMRAVGSYQDVGGWIDRRNKDDVNSAEIRNMRLKVAAQPTERLSLDMSGWISRADYDGTSLAGDDGQQAARFDEPMSTDFDAYALRVGYESESVSVVSATSYLDYAMASLLDLSFLVASGTNLARTDFDARIFAQEVVVNSTADGPWRWTLGGMYRDAKDDQFQRTTTNGVAGVPLNQVYESQSYAVFGSVTRLLADGRFEITGGLRYFEDNVVGTELSRLGGARPLGEYSDDTFTAVSPRVVFGWHPVEYSTIYVSYAEGFRSGFSQSGAAIGAAPQFPPLDADTLRNYELGAKGNFGGGRFEFDTAVYFIDWQDVQQSLLVPNPAAGPGANITALVNGESASGLGADFGFRTRLVRGLEFGANASWNDLTMDSDVIAAGNVALFSRGDRLNLSSELTAGAFAQYEFPFGGSAFQGRLLASTTYVSEMEWRTITGGARRLATGDPISITSASFAIEAPSRWTVTLFGDNLANEQGSPSRLPFSAAVTTWNTHVRPRTVGLQFEYTFR
jgi:iron complex outermembrane recepter protein